MKLLEQFEPNFRRSLQPKRSKRYSYKKYKILRNRILRRAFNRDYTLGKEILNRVKGYEY